MTCECEPLTIADIRQNRAVKASTETMYKLRKFKSAQDRHAIAKHKRADAHGNGRPTVNWDRECKAAADAIREAQKAVWTAYEAWEEAERKLLPVGSDGGD